MTTMFERALAVVKVLSKTYEITLPDGKVYTNKKPVIEEKKNKRNLKYPHGSVRKHFIDRLKDLKEGEIKEIEFGPFNGPHLAKNISSFMSTTFGRRATVTHMDSKRKIIEVLRMPVEQLNR
jgi:hypothetical protein